MRKTEKWEIDIGKYRTIYSKLFLSEILHLLPISGAVRGAWHGTKSKKTASALKNKPTKQA